MSIVPLGRVSPTANLPAREAVRINTYIAQYSKAIAEKTVSQNRDPSAIEVLWSQLYVKISQEKDVDQAGLKEKAQNITAKLLQNLAKKLSFCCEVCEMQKLKV